MDCSILLNTVFYHVYVRLKLLKNLDATQLEYSLDEFFKGKLNLVPKSGNKVGESFVLFARLDEAKMLEEIEKENGNV